MPVIEAESLRRTYRTTTGSLRRRPLEVEAVRGISFAVEQGELFGLLGPNGAGKTTTIKMLITLLLPTGGSARVLGHDVVAEAREVRRKIGYVFGGDRGLYERLSALDNLRYFAELYGVSGREQKRRIAVIARGQIVGPGPPRELKSHVADRTVVEVEAFGIGEDAVRRLRSMPGVTSVSIEDRDQAQVLTIQSPRGLELTRELSGWLDGAEIGLVEAREPTLEDAYVALVTGADD
jgi:ABC-type multidrug transport system ATPase subunit